MGADAYFQAIKTIRLDLLELVGRSYVIEHCTAEINRSHHEKSYRIYVTDTLKAIAENTAKIIKGGGAVMTKRWIDVIEPPKPIKEDNRSCEEIVSGIWARAFHNKRGDK